MMSETNSKPRQILRYLLILPMALFVIACSQVDSQVPETAEKVASQPLDGPEETELTPEERIAKEEAGQKELEVFPQPLNLNEIAQKIGYPKELEEEGIEEKVLVRVKVDTEGSVVEHRLLKEGHPAMRRAVEQHIYDLKFEPGQKDGKAVNVWVTIPFAFKLSE